MSQTTSLESMARALNTTNIGISYSFFGSPYFAVNKPGEQSYCYLDELAQRAYDLSIKPNKTSAMEYMLAGYLIGRVSSLFDLADRAIEQASYITQFFICVRQCLANALAYIEIFDIRHRYAMCYLDGTVEIPKNLIQKEPFLLARTSPVEMPSVAEHVQYIPSRVQIIYQEYLASTAHQQ